MAVNQAPCLLQGFFIVCGIEAKGAENMSFLIEEERAVFVYPQYRSAKGGRARRLIEYSIHAADILGIPLIMGVLSGTRTKGKLALYSRQLGEPMGAFWMYGAKSEPGHGVI